MSRSGLSGGLGGDTVRFSEDDGGFDSPSHIESCR